METDIAEQELNYDRWNLIQRKAQRTISARVVDDFREHSIDPILIKGLAAHLNYPEDHFRYSIDVDISVGPADYEAAMELVVAGLPEQILIDLHKGLRHLDSVDWNDLFKNSVLIDIDGTPVRMLRPEDHLRVLCVHWLNDGGAYKERLWDIYYAVANRPPDFDWNRCLNIVSEVRRRWIICAIGLAHKYLDLYIDDLQFADEARQLPAWLSRAVEKEWTSDVRLLPLQGFLNDRKGFWKQVKKRIPPNPIQSTIEMEGSFDTRSRLHYQVLAGLKRTVPSLIKFWNVLRFRTLR